MDNRCPILNVSGLIGKRWSLLILTELYRGNSKWKRYSVLKKGLAEITPKMLSMRLRELEEQRLITRKVDASSFPVRSEYSLTKRGTELVDVIRGLKEWAIKWKIGNSFCENSDCSECGI